MKCVNDRSETANPAGEAQNGVLRLDFARRVMHQFRGSVVTLLILAGMLSSKLPCIAQEATDPSRLVGTWTATIAQAYDTLTITAVEDNYIKGTIRNRNGNVNPIDAQYLSDGTFSFEFPAQAASFQNMQFCKNKDGKVDVEKICGRFSYHGLVGPVTLPAGDRNVTFARSK